MTEYPKRKPFLIPIEGYRHMSRSLIRFCSKTAAHTEQTVIALLSDALRIHDELETYYISALDPAFLDQTAARIIAEIGAASPADCA